MSNSCWCKACDVLQEGPHCMITEDEFYDAVDATLDKLEKEEEKVRKVEVVEGGGGELLFTVL